MITTPHLDLEQLVGATGPAGPGEAERAHLEACPRCAAELESWVVVAVGVRQLFAATPPIAPRPDGLRPPDSDPGRPETLVPGPSGRRQRPVRAPRRRRALLGAAAVVALIVGGTWYGLAAGDSPKGAVNEHPSARTAGAPGLMAVNGCASLTASAGVLQKVNGSDLVLQAVGGSSVTVVTSPSTRITREVAGSLSDVVDGAHVFVSGSNADGGISASNVLVGTADETTLPSPPPLPGLPSGGSKAGSGPSNATLGLASGTVSDAHAGGFTVVLSDGTRVPVTTGSSTKVVTITSARLDQLQTGVFTIAVGTPGANGTLTATTVEQGSAGPGGLRKPLVPGTLPKPPPPSGLPNARAKLGLGAGLPSLPDVGCKPTAVATAALAVWG